MCLTESAAPFSHSPNRADAETERERERGVCAQRERERPHARAALSFRCIIFSFATSRIHKNMFNSDTQTVVMVINTVNVRVSMLNAHLVYEKHFRGPLAFGGPRQSPTFA